MKLLFVADPLEGFNTVKDTTFVMMREAAARGHTLLACQPRDLMWQRGGRVTGYVREITLTPEGSTWFSAKQQAPDEIPVALAEVDAVRLAVFEKKFRRLTGDTRTASELAALIYLAVAGGLQALARPGSDDRVAAYLRRVIADYLIHRQTPGASSSLAT
jgi:hypothetical protein